jgi:hypothetical protein
MARFSVLLPHYKTWKMSFYTIHQLLRYKGRHQLDIYVIDNHPQDETALLLKGFYGDQIKLFPYPIEKMQSHGIAYDYVIPHLRTEVFCTIESDSFPTSTDWLDYVDILSKDYDSGGSLLDLSGGNFVHTAGAFYKKSVWQKAKRYVDKVEYTYFPNIAMKDNFPCHLMVHDSVLEQFIADPGKLISLGPEYEAHIEKGGSLPFYLGRKAAEYRPIGRGVFHNGIGNRDESFYTYAQRNVIEERHHILQDNKKPLIWRMGCEPGQYLCYWMLANNHGVYSIPTETFWMPGRENQQQEKTVMENGFTHLWAVTAYAGATNPDLKDIIDHKKNTMEELYNSIPAKERI